MEKIFADILDTESVMGVMVFSFDGELIFNKFVSQPPLDKGNKVWWAVFIDALRGIREADIVFENNRLYIRKSEIGYVMILMDIYAPVAMVRLNCDIALPSLKKKRAPKGLMSFFKKK